MDKYDIFEVRLDPQEEIFLDLKLLDVWDDIFSVFLLDVDLEIIVEKTNYIFVPQYDTGPDIEYSKVVEGGVYYIMVMAKVALAEDPNDLSDENAAADYELVINMSKHPEKPPNQPPVVRAGMENLTISMDEDTTKYLNLNDVFEDPEGDKLLFNISVQGGSTDLRTSVDLSGTVTLIPKLNWFGTLVLNFTAEDVEGGKAWRDVNVTVVNRPEPPIVVDYGPSRTVGMAEGGSLQFFIDVEDEDSFVINYTWLIDGVAHDNIFNYLTYVPGYSDSGPHIILVRFTDGDTTAEWDWEVTVNNTNRAPVIGTISPANGTRFDQGKKVNLAATISDPDGDTLSFEWREVLKLIGKGTGIQPDINHTFPPGKHTVELNVWDSSGGIAKAEVEFEDGVDWAILAMGALVAPVVAFLIYAYAPRAKRDDDDLEREMEDEARKEKALKDKGAKTKRKKGGRKVARKKKGPKKRKGKKKEKDEALDHAVAKEVEAERKRMKKKGKAKTGQK
jgi:hypothetical protein